MAASDWEVRFVARDGDTPRFYEDVRDPGNNEIWFLVLYQLCGVTGRREAYLVNPDKNLLFGAAEGRKPVDSYDWYQRDLKTWQGSRVIGAVRDFVESLE